MKKANEIKAALTAGIVSLTALWGWFGWLVVLFAACMAADYLTGSAAAMRRGSWSSEAARDGIWHKAGCIVVVLVAGAADLLIGVLLGNIPGVTLPFDYTVLLCPIVVVWYTLTELGSITENAVALGAPCPPWLTRILKAAQEAVDQAGSLTREEKK